VDPGRSWEGVVGQVDLLGTIAEMIGERLPYEAGEDSQSFYSVLRDPKSKHERYPLINHAMGGRFSVTEGDWKLIMPHGNESHELYNLKRDPGEERNVYAKNLAIANDLERKITEIVCRGRTTRGLPQPNDTGYWDDLSWITPVQYNRLSVRR
jgi:arylsulfatase A